MNWGKRFSIGVFSFAVGACAPAEKNLSGDFATGIVHGEIVKEETPEASSVVALFIQKGQGGGICTATILADDTLLTAAHCVDGEIKKMTVVFGTKIKSTAMDFQREVTASLQHPSWNPEDDQSVGDLAVVHFNGGLPQGYKPVTLAPKNRELKVGEEVYLMGYGVTGLGNRGVGTLRATVTTITGLDSATEVRTSGEKHSVCFGDSGGPAFVRDGDRYLQWGVASAVTSKACNGSSVHTKVTVYESWIRTATNKLRKAVSSSLQEGPRD